MKNYCIILGAIALLTNPVYAEKTIIEEKTKKNSRCTASKDITTITTKSTKRCS